jgi:DNA-binding CsgD family transcriptional regulator
MPTDDRTGPAVDDDSVIDGGGTEPRAGEVPRLLLAGVLLVVAIGGAIDLVFDNPQSWLSVHVLFEVAVMATSLGFAVYLWLGWRHAARSLDAARASLAATGVALEQRRAERDAWRRTAERALAGFGQAVDRQFATWGLTPTEREVGLMLLKGHGHKQIAAATGRSERTVRQHAVSVYEKSGLRGRAELAAFFLDDLFVPGADAPQAADSAPPS